MRRFLYIVCWSLVLVGCGTQTAALTAQDVAQRAATTMNSTKTIHFVITMSGRLTYVDTMGTLGLKQAEGDVVAPDKVRAKVKTSTFGLTNELGVVGIGTQQWATNPLNGRWQTLPPELGSFNLGALFDPKVGIAGLLTTLPWALTDKGSDPYSLVGSVDGAQLAAMTSGMITKGKVDVTLQVDPKSFFVTNARLVERDSSPDQPTTWQIALTMPSGTVEIAPPPLQ